MANPLFSQHDSSEDLLLEKVAHRGEYHDSHTTHRCRRCGRGLVYLHLALIAFYSLMSVAIIRRFIPSGSDHVYSPARSAIHTITYEYDHSSTQSPFVGAPDAHVDKAWHDLLQYSNIRISAAEMAQIDPSGERAQQAVALPDGGYFGGLTATHELHCLKRIYQYMYPDYYFPGISEAERNANRVHNEHCIDMLRQSIMCHADVSPLTMRWGHKQRIPLANFSTPHECRRWDSVVEWSHARQIPRLTEPGWLKHPSLGTVYEEGFQNKIGQVDDN